MKEYNTVKEKIESHFIVKHNVIFEQVKFNLSKQPKGKQVSDNVITDLYCLAEYCESGILRTISSEIEL